ncbi:MAG TPA: hypothetical protein VM870_10625, partial [Pyrinomonadaceae bacterium]|nr:hypothetical protein [Pyrinomonadaceae bacterium]
LDRVEHATNEIINEQLQRACAIVEERRAEIGLLVDALMERDTLESDEIRECFGMIIERKVA